MPANPNVPTTPHRPIKSDLKSHKKVWEKEYPLRWPFMKILRETSNLKQFYPEIDPYAEAYKFRENTWAIYSESFDGMGDPWIYVINGPKKALIVDTGFGVGDLKGLVQKLIGDDQKEIIVANTHSHFDHAYGNAQFDICYCHEDEEFLMRQTMNPHIWDYLYDHETMEGIYTEFDPRDIIPYKDYELRLLKSYECIDLGDGYLVECIPLRGHTTGQAGYLDHQTGCLFMGDTTSAGRAREGDPHPENGCVERLRDDFREIVKRIDEVSGVFPGHGPLDITPVILQYFLNALEAVIADPESADEMRTMDFGHGKFTQCVKYIYQWTGIKYSSSAVYYDQVKKQ